MATPRICSIPDCDKPAQKRGWCNKHYIRWRVHGDTSIVKNPIGKYGPTCTVDGCDNPHLARGFCDKHYQRWQTHGDPLIIAHVPNGTVPQWIDEVAVSYEGDDCLIWPFCRDEFGYGRLHKRGKGYKAHRLICRMVHGKPPTRKHEAAHSCGNGHLGCVNPKHLSWKTRAGNMQDMIEHGRSLRGERSKMAKLTEAEAREILSLKGLATQRGIAARFGISSTTVDSIHHRKTWKHI